MKKAILTEMTDLLYTIANLNDEQMRNEEKNFITGRLTTLSNIIEMYLEEIGKIYKND